MAKPWDEMNREERIALIQPLTAKGMSASQISRQLNCTANSVIGLWHRFPARFDRTPWGKGAGSSGARDSMPKPLQKKVKTRPATPSLGFKQPTRKRTAPVLVDESAWSAKDIVREEPVVVVAAPAPTPIEAPPPPVDIGPRPTLWEVSLFQCRFPLFGEPNRTKINEMFVCGAPVARESAWCPEHHAICHQKATGSLALKRLLKVKAA